jgi:putative flippase GtrA
MERVLTTRAPGHAEQLVRYVAVGGAGYVLAMAIYSLEIVLGVSAYVAIWPAFVANGVFNFVLNRAWSFPSSGLPVRTEALRFCTVAAMTLVANYAVFYLLHGVAGLPPVPAQALTIVLVTPIGFLGNKLWSFRAQT